MTIKLSSLGIDLAADAAGEWVEFPDWPGVAFLVSSYNSPAFAAARSALLTRHARKNGGSLLLDDNAPEVGALLAKHLLHGWRGLDVEYSADKAAEVLSDPSFRPIVAAVSWCVSQVGQIEAEFVKDGAKNSKASSAGA